MKKRAKPGDIFTQKIPNGQYMFGRVLMDIQEQCLKSKLVSIHHSTVLRSGSISYLVDAYDYISDTPELNSDSKVVWHGIVVSPDAFKEDLWTVIGNKPVDPTEIDFYENISYYNKRVSFYKGEVERSVIIDNDNLHYFGSLSLLGARNFFSAVCYLLGKPELARIPMKLKDYDKRYGDPELRKLVYDTIGLDMNMNYYNLALKHGYDTARFFDKDAIALAKKKTKQKQPVPGDIFAERIQNGQYIFGRVLMDISSQCLETNLVDLEKSPLRFKSNDFLVQAYDCICDKPELKLGAKIIWSGIPVNDASFRYENWIIVGFEEVKVSDIDFIEQINYNYYNQEIEANRDILSFTKGEVKFLVKLKNLKVSEFGLLENRKYSELGDVRPLPPEILSTFICILLGRPELAERPDFDIKDYDSKFINAELRRKIYAEIGEDPNMSYNDLALKHGFDTARFFEKNIIENLSKDKDAQKYSELLKGVSWSIFGEKYSTLNEFSKALKEAEVEIPKGVSMINPKLEFIVNMLVRMTKIANS